MHLGFALGVQTVHVLNWPGTTTVEWVTVGVAIATLFGVGYQIKVAREEVGYVKQDLENNRTHLQILMDERAAKPVLTVFADKTTVEDKDDTLGDKLYRQIEVTFAVMNDEQATRPASAIYVELSLPTQVLTGSEFEKRKKKEQQPQIPFGIAFAGLRIPSMSLGIKASDFENTEDYDEDFRTVGQTSPRILPLLPGLKTTISDPMTLYVPRDAHWFRWYVRCAELQIADSPRGESPLILDDEL